MNELSYWEIQLQLINRSIDQLQLISQLNWVNGELWYDMMSMWIIQTINELTVERKASTKLAIGIISCHSKEWCSFHRIKSQQVAEVVGGLNLMTVAYGGLQCDQSMPRTWRIGGRLGYYGVEEEAKSERWEQRARPGEKDSLEGEKDSLGREGRQTERNSCGLMDRFRFRFGNSSAAVAEKLDLRELGSVCLVCTGVVKT